MSAAAHHLQQGLRGRLLDLLGALLHLVLGDDPGEAEEDLVAEVTVGPGVLDHLLEQLRAGVVQGGQVGGGAVGQRPEVLLGAGQRVEVAGEVGLETGDAGCLLLLRAGGGDAVPLEDQGRQLVSQGVLLGRRGGTDVVLLDELPHSLELLLDLLLEDLVDDGGEVVLSGLQAENPVSQGLYEVSRTTSSVQALLGRHDVPHVVEAGDDPLAGLHVVRAEGGELGLTVGRLPGQPGVSADLGLLQASLAEGVSHRLEAGEAAPHLLQPGPELLGDAAGKKAGVDPPLPPLPPLHLEGQAGGGHHHHQDHHRHQALHCHTESSACTANC